MNEMMIDRIKQISIEMKTIVSYSLENGRTTNMEEQDRLDNLADEREELISRVIYYGHY